LRGAFAVQIDLDSSVKLEFLALRRRFEKGELTWEWAAQLTKRDVEYKHTYRHINSLCFRCGDGGHLAKDCPSQLASSLSTAGKKTVFSNAVFPSVPLFGSSVGFYDTEKVGVYFHRGSTSAGHSVEPHWFFRGEEGQQSFFLTERGEGVWKLRWVFRGKAIQDFDFKAEGGKDAASLVLEYVHWVLADEIKNNVEQRVCKRPRTGT